MACTARSVRPARRAALRERNSPPSLALLWSEAVLTSRVGAPVRGRAGKRAVELGAGCGLAGIVASKLGAAAVTLTDLAPALPLLEENARAILGEHAAGAGAAGASAARWRVAELSWGDNSHVIGTFDVVIIADCMYVPEAIDPLVATLVALTLPETSLVYMSYGRNRRALRAFLLASAAAGFVWELARPSEYDAVYKSSDTCIVRGRRLIIN